MRKKNGTNPLVFNKVEESFGLAQDETEVSPAESESKLEEGKEIAEKFAKEYVAEPTKKALAKSKPIIEGIGELLVEKYEAVEAKIAEDRKEKDNSNLAAAGLLSFSDKISEKLPPTFRILYSWLLRFLILVFSVWWIPLIIGILIVLRILLGVYRKVRYR